MRMQTWNAVFPVADLLRVGKSHCEAGVDLIDPKRATVGLVTTVTIHMWVVGCVSESCTHSALSWFILNKTSSIVLP